MQREKRGTAKQIKTTPVKNSIQKSRLEDTKTTKKATVPSVLPSGVDAHPGCDDVDSTAVVGKVCQLVVHTCTACGPAQAAGEAVEVGQCRYCLGCVLCRRVWK